MTAAGETPPTFRWRSATYFLLGAGVLVAGLGVALRAPAPLLFAVPLLLAPIGAALLGPRSPPVAKVQWGESGDGRNVDVVGALTFDPPTDSRDVEAEFSVPVGLEARAPSEVVRSDRQVRFRLRWRAPEPIVVPVTPPHLAWRDPAGLVERSVTAEFPPLTVERYPPDLVRVGAVRLERTIAVPGENLSRGIGASGEFFGIREATPTEPPRRINWVASARAGRRLANEYRVERTGDVILLLDARPTSLGASVDEPLFSLTLAAAHGIADSFLREKARVGLAVYGEFLEAVPLASGRTQRLRIRRALRDARVTRTPGPAERAAIALRRYFPAGVTTILLSSLADDESAHLVPHVRRRGYPVVVLSPSPLPYLETAARSSDAEGRLVARIARLLRRRRLAATWRDAPVVDWEEYWSVAGLVDLLRRPGRIGRGW